MREKMTIFYQKSTGNIKCIADWETSIDDYFIEEADWETSIDDYFIEEGDKADYALIWDTLIIDYNDTIFKNYNIFKIDENKNIVLKNEIVF